jgi:hypothetical protein
MGLRAHGYVLILRVLPWACALPSCVDCDRVGCDSLTQRATPEGTGLAGVVAELSDVEVNGCAECPLGQATLQLWQLEAPVESAAAAAALASERAPDQTEIASGHFRLALQPGAVLLCVRPNCINLTVSAGETSTVNIKLRDGSTGFFVERAAGARLEEDFGFSVGF